MNYLSLISLLSLVILPSLSLADPIAPGDNVVGLYFDQEATQVCSSATPFTQIPVYVILTNPTFESLVGFELGISTEGSMVFLQTEVIGGGMWPPMPGNVIQMIQGGPVLMEDVTILMTCILLNTDTVGDPILFWIHGSDPSSLPGDLPVLLLPDGVLLQADIPCAPGEVCAQINGECGVVSQDQVAWDHVKGLYR